MEGGQSTKEEHGMKFRGRKRKNSKRRTGSQEGASMFHSLLNGELAKRMKEAEAQNYQGRKIGFKIVEKGGVTLENLLRRSNPWSEESCGRADCFPCKGGGRGVSCWKKGVVYALTCQECNEEVATYFGESGRNAYSRRIYCLRASKNMCFWP